MRAAWGGDTFAKSMVMPALEVVPPRYPRAPTQAAWLAMTEAERRAVADALPAYMTEAECLPGEGDPHFDAKAEGRETLRGFFGRTGVSMYIGSELTVYYPDEERFSPDLLAVRDVPTGPRQKWVVSAEGKGLDWVLEVVVAGDRWKDLQRNVVRYARLGIAEYFVFDRARKAVMGWRLHDTSIGIYTPIAPHAGQHYSEVLGLFLTVQGNRLRFLCGNAELLTPAEEMERLEDRANDLAMLREDALRQRLPPRLSDARRRLSGHATRRRAPPEAEARVQALEAELARLRGGT